MACLVWGGFIVPPHRVGHDLPVLHDRGQGLKVPLVGPPGLWLRMASDLYTASTHNRSSRTGAAAAAAVKTLFSSHV